jgi:hypothetical protein
VPFGWIPPLTLLSQRSTQQLAHPQPPGGKRASAHAPLPVVFELASNKNAEYQAATRPTGLARSSPPTWAAVRPPLRGGQGSSRRGSPESLFLESIFIDQEHPKRQTTQFIHRLRAGRLDTGVTPLTGAADGRAVVAGMCRSSCATARGDRQPYHGSNDTRVTRTSSTTSYSVVTATQPPLSSRARRANWSRCRRSSRPRPELQPELIANIYRVAQASRATSDTTNGHRPQRRKVKTIVAAPLPLQPLAPLPPLPLGPQPPPWPPAAGGS